MSSQCFTHRYVPTIIIYTPCFTVLVTGHSDWSGENLPKFCWSSENLPKFCWSSENHNSFWTRWKFNVWSFRFGENSEHFPDSVKNWVDEVHNDGCWSSEIHEDSFWSGEFAGQVIWSGQFCPWSGQHWSIMCWSGEIFWVHRISETGCIY